MVYVLNSDGSPLMPCTEAKARHLIQRKMAVVVERIPFTIRLCFQVDGGNGQDVILGLDAGSKTIGISATSGNRVLYEAEVAIRQDISRLIEARKTGKAKEYCLWYIPPTLIISIVLMILPI